MAEPKRNGDRTALSLRRGELARLRTARAQRLWQASTPYRLLRAFREKVGMTELRALSLVPAPLGLVALFRCLILPLLTDDFPLLFADGVAGIFLSLLALLFFTYPAPLSRAVSEDTMLSRLLFDTLALPRPYLSARRGISSWLLLTAGLALGVLGVFFSPLLLFGILFAALFFALTLESPEFSLILLGFLFPLAPLLPSPNLMLSLSLGLTLLSFLLKLAIGKRRVTLEVCDLFVLLLAVLVLLSGLVLGGRLVEGADTGLFAAVFIVSGYFLSANLLATPRTLYLFLRGVLFTGALVSALGIFAELVMLTSPPWQEHELAALLTERFLAITESREGFFGYLLLLFPLLLGVTAGRQRGAWRYLPSFLLLLGALFVSRSVAVYLALLLSLLLFLLPASGRRARVLFFLLAILPNLVFLLPESAFGELAAGFSFLGAEGELLSHYTAFWELASLVRENPTGVGLGNAGISGSLYLRLAADAGVAALIALCVVLADAALRVMPASVGRDSRLALMRMGVLCGLLALLVFGATSFPFDNLRVVLLSSLLLGALTAARRIAAEEATRPDVLLPGEAASAAAEVRLQKKRRK